MVRFIKEYANSKKRRIMQIEALTDAERTMMCQRIDRAVKAEHRGLITTDEAMMEIARA